MSVYAIIISIVFGNHLFFLAKAQNLTWVIRFSKVSLCVEDYNIDPINRILQYDGSNNDKANVCIPLLVEVSVRTLDQPCPLKYRMFIIKGR